MAHANIEYPRQHTTPSRLTSIPNSSDTLLGPEYVKLSGDPIVENFLPPVIAELLVHAADHDTGHAAGSG
jgi:hypothetical protein